VPRLWKPAVQCPECAYPNDDTFHFCQQCGYNRKPRLTGNTPSLVPLNLEAINARLHTLRSVRESKPYEKQKSRLQQELESFLFSLPSAKSVLEATPEDIIRFLVWKDRSGKTKVHSPSCVHFGLPKTQCPCPTTLPAGTVDSVIGKVRSLFIDLGRAGNWNELLGIGNPAAHKSVKQYLASIREEQAKHRVTPKQAVPLFFDK